MTKRCDHIDHILLYIRAIPLIATWIKRGRNALS